MANVDAAKVRDRLCQRGGKVDRAMAEAANEIRKEARKLWAERVQLPQYETRDYRSNFRVVRSKEEPCGWIASNVDSKANWIEYGTGIYGPYGTPIVPTQADNLVFFWDREQRWVTTPEVRGRPASNVMNDAAKNVAARGGHVWRPDPSAAKRNRPSSGFTV